MSAPCAGWSEVRRRLSALGWEKVTLTVVLNVVFWGGYGWLSRHPSWPVRGIPETWLDRHVVHAPTPWVLVYLSQFLLTSMLPWMIDSGDVLRRYVRALAFLSAVSFAIFYFWPVASPRPAEFPDSQLAGWVAQLDGRYNAFPSLHAGFLVIMAGLGWRMGHRKPGALLVVCFVLWAAAILYSTLATKQHYVWDLVAGMALGGLADFWAWRGFTRCEPAPLEKPVSAAR